MTPLKICEDFLDFLNLLTVFGEIQVIISEMDCEIFYTNLHELFCQFISWTNWVNSGKFMDNCWILCQIMADIKKVYDNLIINNLYQSWRFWTRQIVSWQSATHTVCTEHISLITFQVAQPPVIPLHNKYVQCMYYVLNSLFAPLYLSISII